MDLSTILGILMALGGSVWGVWTWVKAKAPKAQDLVEDLFQRLQSTDVLKPVAPPAPPSRMEALEHIEALIQFMEANGNKEGSDALVAILKEILTKKV
jgi:hypothetical protein